MFGLKYNNIKNEVALKEVCSNNGYDVKIENKEIKIATQTKRLAVVKEEVDRGFMINVMGNNLSKDDANTLLKELSKAIDILDYLNESIL